LMYRAAPAKRVVANTATRLSMRSIALVSGISR
jgi:hypothetical protein